MFRACLAMLVVLAALFAGYYWWLSKTFDPPGVWIGAAVMALVAGGSLGALINSRAAYREWSLAAAARHDLPWRDGRWTAVTGLIHPVSEPLLAPFSGEECVLCEYDVASQHRISSASRDSDGNPGSDFTGFLMNPCVVRTSQGDIRLLGFPNLVGFGERTIMGYAAVLRAYDFMTTSEFENYSGLKLVSVISAITDAWRDDDGLVRKNLRLGKTQPAELFPVTLKQYIASLPPEATQPTGQAAASEGLDQEEENDLAGEADDDLDDELDDDLEDQLDDELDDDLDDDDSPEMASPPDIPLLKEKRVKVGDQVCAIGIYSGEKRGLVPGGLGADRFIKLVRGTIANVEREARNSTFGRLIGGLVGLVLVHGVAYGVMMANRHHPDAVKHRRRDAFMAVTKADLPALEKLVARGVSVNDRNEQGETLLSEAHKPEAVRWLIEHGADLNTRSDNGRTALMDAASRGRPEIAKLLIDAKADLDLTTSDGLAAIDYARSNGRDDIVAMLRAAGAKEGVVTVEPTK
jgi:Ankyrin repeats (3 copies)